MGFRATMYGSQKSHYPWLKCHENEEKIDNDYVLRNDHRIKTTQPISMILVSFFYRRQCFIWWNQNMLYFRISRLSRALRFFWDTRYKVDLELNKTKPLHFCFEQDIRWKRKKNSIHFKNHGWSLDYRDIRITGAYFIELVTQWTTGHNLSAS